MFVIQKENKREKQMNELLAMQWAILTYGYFEYVHQSKSVPKFQSDILSNRMPFSGNLFNRTSFMKHK